MAQAQYTEQDAWSLAQKLDQFVQELTPGETAAWEAMERHVSTLVPTEDSDVQGYAFTPDQVTMMGLAHAQELRNQAAQMSRANEAARAKRGSDAGGGASGVASQRQSLWYRVVTTLSPPRRATGEATPS
jgi:hypothetical protein